jgi:hypothetical protein
VGKYQFLSSQEAFKVGSLENFLTAISKTTFCLVPHCSFDLWENDEFVKIQIISWALPIDNNNCMNVNFKLASVSFVCKDFVSSLEIS